MNSTSRLSVLEVTPGKESSGENKQQLDLVNRTSMDSLVAKLEKAKKNDLEREFIPAYLNLAQKKFTLSEISDLSHEERELLADYIFKKTKNAVALNGLAVTVFSMLVGLAGFFAHPAFLIFWILNAPIFCIPRVCDYNLGFRERYKKLKRLDGGNLEFPHEEFEKLLKKEKALAARGA